MTRSAEIRALPREVAAKGKAVLVRGVVSYSTRKTHWGMVLENEGEGIYVDGSEARTRGLLSRTPAWLEPLQRGMLVEVRGITGPGHFAPLILPTDIKVLGTVVGGEHDDAGFGEFRANPLQRGNAVGAGHAHVHERDIGAMLAEGGHGLLRVFGFGDHDEIVFLANQHGQAAADDGVIVHDKQSDGLRLRHGFEETCVPPANLLSGRTMTSGVHSAFALAVAYSSAVIEAPG